MKKMVVMTPKYEDYDPRTRESIKKAIKEIPDISFTFLSEREVYIHASRRKLLQHALAIGPFDYYLWLDSDIEFTPLDIHKAIEDIDSGLHAVTGLYFSRHGNNNAMVCFGDLHNGFRFDRWFEPEFARIPVDACGFGFFMLSSQLIKDYTIYYNPLQWFDSSRWFPEKFPRERRIYVCGEDLDFCLKARHLNYEIMLNTGIILKHKGIGYAEYKANFGKPIPHCPALEEHFDD